MLRPARARLALWPFKGAFRDLLAPGRIALAETYPAEAARQLGLPRSGSKRRPADRRAWAEPLAASLKAAWIRPTPELVRAIADGFGSDAAGKIGLMAC